MVEDWGTLDWRWMMEMDTVGRQWKGQCSYSPESWLEKTGPDQHGSTWRNGRSRQHYQELNV